VGNSLSDASLRALTKAKLKPGSIIHIFCDFIRPPKNKFCVIIHTDYEEETLLFFFVNSEIAEFIEKNSEMKFLQVELIQKNYPFFSKDISYMNCAEVKDELEVDFVITHLLNHPTEFKGSLLESDVEKVIEKLHSSKTIGEYERELIINSLDG